MAEVLFYHLERSTLAQVLPGLLQRSLERGWRCGVLAGSDDAAEEIDAALWTYDDGSFLPHGRVSTAQTDARQPILIDTALTTLVDGRDVVFLVAGGQADPAQMASFTRVVVMFDGQGAAPARVLWTAVKAEGLEATYWRQSDTGKWEKKA